MTKEVCNDCYHMEIKDGEFYCEHHKKGLGAWGLTNPACDDLMLNVYVPIDVSGCGYETEIKNRITNKQYGVTTVLKLLNYQHHEIKRLAKENERLSDEVSNLLHRFGVSLILENKISDDVDWKIRNIELIKASKIEQAKLKNKNAETMLEATLMIDTIFYYVGYLKALKHIKEELELWEVGVHTSLL